MTNGTELAPPGHIWICGACGKRSLTRYGFIGDGTPSGSNYLTDGSCIADRGWDESCMLNAALTKLEQGSVGK